jgi:hypothetical protein
METQKTLVCMLLVFAGIAAIMAPFLRYVSVGWRAKRNDIMDGLDADARLAYFEMFCRSGVALSAPAASAEFEVLYSRWYGRRFFVVPGLCLCLVSLLSITSVVFSAMHMLGYARNLLFDVPTIAIAAVAGAYMWVVNDFISRARRLDFAPSDVQWGVLRLIISVPMGYSCAAVAAPAVGPFIAFAVGAFPLSTLTSMLQKLANKSLGLEPTAEEASDDIIRLQGINKTIVERLSNEDITTVTQIAYCNPVRLVMRSNLNFNFVTDCMNQALAWMYLQDGLVKIRSLGLRGAIEIKNLIDGYDGAIKNEAKRAEERARAVAAFPKIAAALNQEPETLQIVFRQIAKDPYTIFLYSIWI